MRGARAWGRLIDRGVRQRRAFVGGGLLLVVSVVMLVWAARTDGFTRDLLLNLGASVVLAAISYVIFDPLFEEARKARVEEHLSFDQETFIQVLGRTCRRVRILDTWTILLEGRHRDRTLTAVRAALDQGAHIQVLLLDPDCTAAQQRSEELERQRVDVPGQIRENLRHLHTFWTELPNELRPRFQVHIYDASPSIQLYQWDGRALISFFPIGKLSFNVPQLEVDMASPWGEFVHARFEELWDHHRATLALEKYWSVPVVLRHAEHDMARDRVPYVTVDGEHYIDCRTFHLTRDVVGALTVRANLPSDGARSGPAVFTLVEVGADDPALAPVSRVFDDKYGESAGRMILRLVPVTPRVPDPRTPRSAGGAA